MSSAASSSTRGDAFPMSTFSATPPRRSSPQPYGQCPDLSTPRIERRLEPSLTPRAFGYMHGLGHASQSPLLRSLPNPQPLYARGCGCSRQRRRVPTSYSIRVSVAFPSHLLIQAFRCAQGGVSTSPVDCLRLVPGVLTFCGTSYPPRGWSRDL